MGNAAGHRSKRGLRGRSEGALQSPCKATTTSPAGDQFTNFSIENTRPLTTRDVEFDSNHQGRELGAQRHELSGVGYIATLRPLRAGKRLGRLQTFGLREVLANRQLGDRLGYIYPSRSPNHATSHQSLQ
jgi:hypothetical protein